MSQDKVEVVSAGATRTVLGGEAGPWWIRYAMQAGFLFVLCMVLWGIYDLMKHKVPTVAEPVERIATLAIEGEKHLKAQAEASTRAAAAAERQAAAIERWVNMQTIPRMTGHVVPMVPTAFP